MRKQDIIRHSRKAICGINEREINVPRQKVSQTIKQLRAKGFYVVGKSVGKTAMKKIWFIRRGNL